jgi:hypothetical protein
MFTSAEFESSLRSALLSTKGTPLARVTRWEQLVPFTALIGDEFTAEVLSQVPEVAGPVVTRRPKKQYSHDPARRLLARAIERATALSRATYFPALSLACLDYLRNAWDEAGRHHALAELGWPLVRWLRKLAARKEAAEFLDNSRGLWPNPEEALAVRENRIGESQEATVRAVLVHAVLKSVAEEDATLPSVFAEVCRLVSHPDTGSTPRWLRMRVVAECASATAVWPVGEALSRQEALLARLAPMRDVFTTRDWYSRQHLVVAEAVVLAFPAVRGI